MIKEKIFKKIKKKDKGSVIESILTISMTFALLCIMILVFATYMSNLDRRDDIDLCARSYILKMETTGYMDSDMEASMRLEMQDYGLTNIDISGTTTSQVSYGEPIVLNVTGDLKVIDAKILDVFKVSLSNTTTEIHVRKVSTAKN